MSKYTTSIEVIICSQTSPSLSIYERIEEGRKFLFDFDYEVPSADFRKSFETQFIEKYWVDCIGYETVPLFKMKLKQRLEMIMPEVVFKYNALQKIMEINEPNLDRYGESHESGKNNASSSANSQVAGSGKNKDVSSNAPSNIISANNIGNVTYADLGRLSEASNTSTGSSSSSNKADHSIERTFKEYGNLLDGYEKWFEFYTNIMAELIKSFDDMFIQLFF